MLRNSVERLYQNLSLYSINEMKQENAWIR